MEPVRRPNYDLITGASSVEINRLLSQFIPVLEELNKNEDIRKQLLRQCVFLNNTKHHNGSVHMFIWQFKQSQQASVQEQPQQASVQLQQQQLQPQEPCYFCCIYDEGIAWALLEQGHQS